MSALSHCLTEIMDGSGLSQVEWANRTQINATLLSRYRTGKVCPDLPAVERLVEGCPESDRARLVKAYLQDHIPNNCSHLILVMEQSGKVREEEPMPSDFNTLDRKTQKAFLHLIKLAVRDSDAQAAVQSTARYLGCKI